MPKTKKYLPYPLFLIAVVGIAGFVWYLLKSPRVTPEPIGINEITATGSVGYSLTPATINTAAGTETTVSFKVDSGADKLALAKFEITYDPAKVTVSNLTVGTWITKQLTAVTVSGGKITGELGAQPDPDPTVTSGGPELNRTGVGTLLTFKVKGLTAGTHTVGFNNANSTAWTVTGSTANTSNRLKTTAGTTLTITNPRPATDLVDRLPHAVDKYDYVELVNQYGKAGSADFDHSGTVGAADYTVFMADYGKTW